MQIDNTIAKLEGELSSIRADLRESSIATDTALADFRDLAEEHRRTRDELTANFDETLNRLLSEALENLHEELAETAHDQAVLLSQENLDLPREFQSISSQILTLDNRFSQRLQSTERQVALLDKKLAKTGGHPEIVLAKDRRIRAAQAKGRTLQARGFVPMLSGSELAQKLREHDFFLSDHIAGEILSKLQSRKVLVLEGVPGTGKSELARHLSDILLETGHGEKFTQVTVYPEASVWDSIGGLRMVEGKYFLPHFGWLTEAILKSIETDGNHWLILDEINRGDTSNLLGPALDALEPTRQGGLDHPHLFPESESQGGVIPIPGSFRIIGTKNPFDSDVLFDFTHALSRRIGTVVIPPLIAEEEITYLNRVVVPAELKRAGVSPEMFTGSTEFRQLLMRLCQVVRDIRELAKREPIHQFQHCEIGTAIVRDLAEQLCRRSLERPSTTEAEGESILDEILSLTLFDRIDRYSRQALKVLRHEVFDATWAPICSSRLAEALGTT